MTSVSGGTTEVAAGITHVVAGPLVRSSYHADGQAELVRDLRAKAVTAGRAPA